mgnify:CR=1 FL=1
MLILAVTAGLLAYGAMDQAKPPTSKPIPPRPAVAATPADLASANNAFALDLHRALRDASKDDGNLFFSPYSISSALAMTYEGARENTALQMQKPLYLPGRLIGPGHARLRSALESNYLIDGFEFTTANALWPDDDLALLETYTKALRDHYGSKVEQLDFSKPQEATQTINKWVSDRTKGKIPQLINEGMVDPQTQLILTNAVYFKGLWEHEFYKSNTKPAPFTIDLGGGQSKQVTVQLMSDAERFGYMETDQFQALEMNYTTPYFERGGHTPTTRSRKQVSMVVFLPKARSAQNTTALRQLEAQLSGEKLNDCLSKLKKIEVRVHFPKFDIHYEQLLNTPLADLGMTDLFKPGLADLSGMTGSKGLHVAWGLHEAVISVDEKGTEAAAGTAIAAQADYLEPPTFRADRPFLFLIREKSTNTILFMGRVTDPTSK